MSSLNYVTGIRLTSRELFALLSMHHVCKWCRAAHTRSRRSKLERRLPEDTWVRSPLGEQNVEWICITCYLDLVCACSGDDEWFRANPDRVVVERIAKQEGLSVSAVRRGVWEHQLTVLRDERLAGRDGEELEEFELFLRRLLTT
jgi:hypothetical protein